MYFAGNPARAHPVKRCKPFEFHGVCRQIYQIRAHRRVLGGLRRAPTPTPRGARSTDSGLQGRSRTQGAEGRGRGAHTPAQPEPTRSRSCELEFPMFLTLFLLLHSDILAQGMVHAAAIAGHAETERAPCCLPYCLGGFSAAIISMEM